VLEEQWLGEFNSVVVAVVADQVGDHSIVFIEPPTKIIRVVLIQRFQDGSTCAVIFDDIYNHYFSLRKWHEDHAHTDDHHDSDDLGGFNDASHDQTTT
jgi:hypothetical protein